jgi:hypothetical protein
VRHHRLLILSVTLAIAAAASGCAGVSQAVDAYGAAAVTGAKATNDYGLSRRNKVALCATPVSALVRHPELVPAVRSLCLPAKDDGNVGAGARLRGHGRQAGGPRRDARRSSARQLELREADNQDDGKWIVCEPLVYASAAAAIAPATERVITVPAGFPRVGPLAALVLEALRPVDVRHAPAQAAPAARHFIALLRRAARHGVPRRCCSS